MSMPMIEGLTRALFEEAGDALFLFDPDSEVLVAVNSVAERLTQTPRAELLRRPATYWFRYGGKGGQERLAQAAAKTGVFHSQEGYFLRTRVEGTWVPVNLTICRLHVQPRVLALVTARDVREQREAYARLQRAEAELRRVLNSVSDCLWSAEINAAGRWSYRYFSPVVERITGRPASFFMGGPAAWEQAVHPEDRPRWRAAIARLRAGQPSQEEYRVVWPDGTGRWVRESVQVSRGDAEGTHRLDGVLTEVSERKQTEQELKKLNGFLDSIVDNLPIMLFVKEAQGLRFEVFNRAGEDLLGYRRADLIGKNDYDIFPSQEADFFIRKDREVLEGRHLVEIPAEAIETRTGRKILHTLKIPILDDQGAPRYLLGISQDVTDRVALEETRRQYAEVRDRYARELESKNQALVESELRYRELTEATLDAIVVSDAAGQIVLFNPAAERLFGFGAAEMLGRPLADLLAPEHGLELAADLERYVNAGTARFVDHAEEFQGRHKNGAAFPLELALSALARGGATTFLAAIRDLTERNRLRHVLTQTEKLASVGRLSAGIAHEINNPLTFVTNNLAVLDRDCQSLLALVTLYEEGQGPQAAALAEEIDLAYVRDNLGRLLARTQDGLQRVTRIIHSLRGYARTAPARQQDVHLAELFDSSLEIVQSKLRDRAIRVERHYDHVPRLRCAATEINQVIVNLLVNACQAIEACPPSHDGLIRIALRRAGAEVLAEVADNGCGIDPADQARLFDPFFTTKEVGEGTGLGLWISQNIVSAHGGRLEVESQPGCGTCFRIALPLVPPEDDP